MKQGNLNLEYQEQSDTILFKCKDSGTEYHHSSLDFEFVRAEIDKKNKSTVNKSSSLTYKYCRSIGFCEHGIKNFCDTLGIDIGGTFTKKELISICAKNEDELFKLMSKYTAEINKLIGDFKFSDKILKKYMSHSYFPLRALVADQGYALEILKDDLSNYVRTRVVKQGYAIDELKNDKSWAVRAEVARQGHELEHFKNDSDYYVRSVAGHGRYEVK